MPGAPAELVNTFAGAAGHSNTGALTGGGPGGHSVGRVVSSETRGPGGTNYNSTGDTSSQSSSYCPPLLSQSTIINELSGMEFFLKMSLCALAPASAGAQICTSPQGAAQNRPGSDANNVKNTSVLGQLVANADRQRAARVASMPNNTSVGGPGGKGSNSNSGRDGTNLSGNGASVSAGPGGIPGRGTAVSMYFNYFEKKKFFAIF